MVRLSKVSAVLGLLCVFATSDSFAYARVWDHYCWGTSFTTCASVKLSAWESAITEGQYNLALQVWNHGGWLDSDRAAVIRQIGLRNLPTDVTYTFGATQGPYLGDTEPAAWTLKPDDPNDDVLGPKLAGEGWQFVVKGTATSGIASSCDPDGLWTWTNPECAGVALNDTREEQWQTGWVVIRFTTDRLLTQAELNQVELGMSAYQPALGWHGCIAGRGDCVSAVPEPVTMLLLGTGLAGISGAGLLRRRRQNGDVVDA